MRARVCVSKRCEHEEEIYINIYTYIHIYVYKCLCRVDVVPSNSRAVHCPGKISSLSSCKPKHTEQFGCGALAWRNTWPDEHKHIYTHTYIYIYI